MSRSGWCIDELMALDLDQPNAANRLHNNCHTPHCTCPQHEEPK